MNQIWPQATSQESEALPLPLHNKIVPVQEDRKAGDQPMSSRNVSALRHSSVQDTLCGWRGVASACHGQIRNASLTSLSGKNNGSIWHQHVSHALCPKCQVWCGKKSFLVFPWGHQEAHLTADLLQPCQQTWQQSWTQRKPLWTNATDKDPGHRPCLQSVLPALLMMRTPQQKQKSFPQRLPHQTNEQRDAAASAAIGFLGPDRDVPVVLVWPFSAVDQPNHQAQISAGL